METKEKKKTFADEKTSVVLMELRDAFGNETYKDLILKYSSKLTVKYPDKFAYFNEAMWSRGYFLYVPKNVQIEKPLTVKSFSEELNSFEAVRNFILLEEGSGINLIDEISSLETANPRVTADANFIRYVFDDPGTTSDSWTRTGMR